MQNKHVDDDNGDGVDNSDGGANKHLTHFSQAVDCCLTERSKQNKYQDLPPGSSNVASSMSTSYTPPSHT
eukprot:11169311-Ditylum_brightwellii.AAC.1